MIFLLALPMLYLAWRLLRRLRVTVSHRETFTLGFLWYAGLPLALASSQLPLTSPALTGWRAIATLMTPARMQTEIIWGVGVWLVFVAGAAFVGSSRGEEHDAEELSDDAAASWRIVLTVMGLASILFGMAWGFANRAQLFAGYAFEYDATIRGPLQAALVYTTVAAIIAFLRRRDVGRMPLVATGAALVILNILSLSIGTRSMTALMTIMLVVVASRLRGGLPRGVLLAVAGLALAGLSVLAAWRQGTRDLAFALLSPALESLYTYISAATYLTFNQVDLLKFPFPLLGSAVNLVPRVLWPNKVDFLTSLMDGIDIFAPLGATHLFVSLLINFGWIGSLLAVFAAGIGIEKLSRSSRPAYIASYAVIVAALTTDLWRNPFSQSLIKSVFQGALLVPCLMTLASAVLTYIQSRWPVPAGLRPTTMPRSVPD